MSAKSKRKPLNRRYVLWAQAHGRDPYEFINKGRATIRPKVDGTQWAAHYINWIQQRWRMWAGTLGYTRTPDGQPPHRTALSNGHTHAEFDLWLEDNAKR